MVQFQKQRALNSEPQIEEMLIFMDPEIIEMVDKSFMEILKIYLESFSTVFGGKYRIEALFIQYMMEMGATMSLTVNR